MDETENMQKAIICVDDEAIILLSLVQELKHHYGSSFIYEQASNGASAIEIIESLAEEGIQTALIISDWLMAGMKGDELLNTVAATYTGVKGILITGHADRTALESLSRNPIVLSIVEKPWRISQIVDIIDTQVLA